MNHSILFIELSLSVGVDEFTTLLDSAYQKAFKKDHRMYEVDFGHLDESLISKGVGVAYHDDKKKKKIRLMVYPGLIIGDDSIELWKPSSENASRLTDKLDKLIAKYFRSEYGLDDFKVSRVDFAADMDIGSRERVSDYIKVLRGIGKVKLFSRVKYDKDGGIIDKDRCFALKGNSNGVEFWAYGLKSDKEVLRAEVRLTKKSTIRAYCGDEPDTSSLIKVLAKSGDHIIMDTFWYIVPPGDYYKKVKAEELIRERVSEAKLRRRMLCLLMLIPEKKSVHLAIKASNIRDIKPVMAAFAEIDVSPVTISKRHDVKRLESLYSYLG
jgi:hypothetical protein